jgi:hypothetical protein
MDWNRNEMEEGLSNWVKAKHINYSNMAKMNDDHIHWVEIHLLSRLLELSDIPDCLMRSRKHVNILAIIQAYCYRDSKM